MEGFNSRGVQVTITWCSARHATIAASLAGASFFCLFLALLGPNVVQHALDAGVRQAVVWRPDSSQITDIRYRGVCDPSDPQALFSHVTAYLYNITNVEQMRQGAKPHVALIGPYRYLKLQCKLDVWWDSDGRVLSKDYTRYLEYPGGPLPGDADLSAPITTLNLALGGVVEAVHGSVGPTTARLLDLVVSVLAGWRDQHVNGMFVHRTARELLWGYEDALLVRLQRLLPPGTVPRTRVQLLQNATSPEEARRALPTMIDTGAQDISSIWNVVSDKGLRAVTGWPGGEECVEHVRGSDGMQFRPGLHCTRDRLRVWMSALFRSTELVCTGPQLFYGVKLLRYWPDPSWTAPDPCKSQYIPGLINITAPAAVGPGGNGSQALGTPIFVSHPHFCGCDMSLREGVEGLPGCVNAEQDLAVWLDVEPTTGITFRAAQSVMVSSTVTPAARQHLEPRLNNSAIIPVMWTRETIEAKQEQATQLASRVYWAKRFKAHLRIWPLLIALFAAAACACVLVHASVSQLAELRAAQDRAEEEDRRARQEYIQRAIRNSHGLGVAAASSQGSLAAMALAEGMSNHTSEPGALDTSTSSAAAPITVAAVAADGNEADGLRQPLLQSEETD